MPNLKGAMIVLCDVDGVLAQWKKAFRYHLSQVDFHVEGINWISPDLPLTKAQREYAWLKMSERDVAYELDDFPGAIKGLDRIIEIADVYFVTAQVEMSPTWSYDRTNWLIKHFGVEQGEKIVLTHHKHLVGGDALIDDKEYNIKAWKKAHPNGLAILWDHPHNHGQDTVGIRCGDWDALYDMLVDTDKGALGKEMNDEVRRRLEELDECVHEWHDDRANGEPDLQLHEYLGLTYKQYELYVRNPEKLVRQIMGIGK